MGLFNGPNVDFLVLVTSVALSGLLLMDGWLRCRGSHLLGLAFAITIVGLMLDLALSSFSGPCLSFVFVE